MTQPYSNDDTLPDPAAYSGYECWKDWSRPFTYTEDHDAYFRGETQTLAIQGADILEIGFGSGEFLAWAHENGASSLAGTEFNAAMIEAAKKQDIEILPVQLHKSVKKYKNRFDTIAAFDVFEHMSIPEIVGNLEAVENLLKPGGKLILRFPNAQSPFGMAPQNGDFTHKSFLSKSVFEQLTVSSGLSVVQYGPSYRISNGGLLKKLVRCSRYLSRDLVSFMFNLIYAQNIPWDPVVVLILEKVTGEGQPAS